MVKCSFEALTDLILPILRNCVEADVEFGLMAWNWTVGLQGMGLFAAMDNFTSYSVSHLVFMHQRPNGRSIRDPGMQSSTIGILTDLSSFKDLEPISKRNSGTYSG